MQLKIQRSQRAAAISGKVIFCLDARVYLTPDEQSNVNKYGLRGQVIYNSEASKKQLDAAAQAHAQGSYFKSLARIALVAMNLNISINSLQKGQHVECKDLDELLSAEEALHEACEKLKSYLETAATFDGREVVIDYSTDTPTVIAPSNPIGIPAPITAAAPPPTIAAPAAPPDLSQPSEHVPLPVQTSAASGAIAFYDGTRDKAAFPNTPDLEAVKRWWFSLTAQKRIFAVSGVSIVLGPLLFGWAGFLLALACLAVYVGYEMLTLSR